MTIGGLIAILRGLPPEHAAEVGEALYAAGFRTLEVPLNSPRPLESIALLRAALPADCLVGAGTVLSVADVTRVRDAGGQLVISPQTSAEVIAATRAAGLMSCPGAATPTEAFTAIAAGASLVKVYPAQQVGTSGMKAWGDVLPADIPLLPVGGIRPDTYAAWARAGAAGLGLGAALYTPDISLAELRRRADEAVATWAAAGTAAHAEPVIDDAR